jgi:hypothetical protein
MKKKLIVKIAKSSHSDFWAAQHIGEIHEAEECEAFDNGKMIPCYRIYLSPDNAITVHQEDCEIVERD